MIGPRRTRMAVGLAAFAVAVSRFLTRARIPDDYDGIGFTRALEHFDMAQLQPHFPGYPVFVALGQAAAALGLSPLNAAALVSALAAAATAAALFRLGSVLGDRASAGWAALAIYGAAWLPWFLGGAALSDGTATAFAALAFAALTYDGVAAAAGAGVGIALMLGTRLSYWPLALSFTLVAARRPRRGVVLAGAIAGDAAWLIPFIAVVGARALVMLGRTHVTGHFSTWGGSIATQPNLPLRLWAFTRGLVYDGIFAHAIALAAATLVLLLVVLRARPRMILPWRLIVVAAVPYALWVLFAQNVIDQPRHLLPLVALACVILGVVVAHERRAAAALVLLALGASLPLLRARVTTLPAAAQAALWTAAQFPARNQVAVFGGRSMRFYELEAPSLIARPRTWLSEVDVELERLDVLPHTLYITSEVEIDPSRARRVEAGPTFCRDARLDRAQPCLTLSRYRLF